MVDLKPVDVMPHGLGVDGAIDMVDDAELVASKKALHMPKLFLAKSRTIGT